MTAEDFATRLGALIAEALKDGLAEEEVVTELDLAIEELSSEADEVSPAA